MSNFESYILNPDTSVIANLGEGNTEIIRDLREEGCLSTTALYEASMLQQTQPNLFVVSECLAAYQRLNTGSREAEVASRIGMGIGAMVAASSGYGLTGRHNFEDISVADRDSFYAAEWWPLEFLLQAVDKRYADAVYPMHEAMDYHLDFDGMPAASYQAARLGATVCFALVAHRRQEIEVAIDELWLEQSTQSEVHKFIESRGAVATLSAIRHYLA